MAEFDISTACCFTGHRPDKLNLSESECKEKLKIYIEKAINDGFKTFISGMAKGIDVWAGEVVLELKKTYPDISLFLAYPFNGFNKGTTYKEKALIDYLKKSSSGKKVLQPSYSKSSFQKRNMWMVDNSSLVLAFYNGTPGGTLNTINYAKKQNTEVIIIK